MLGFGPLGAYLLGGGPTFLDASSKRATLTVSALIIPEQKVHEGLLVRSTSAIWLEIA
jgi:hypothetical protein